MLGRDGLVVVLGRTQAAHRRSGPARQVSRHTVRPRGGLMRRAQLGRLLLHVPSALLLLIAGLFYSYVLRARIALGRWPLPYDPDPKTLGFDLHRALIWLSGTVLVALPALWLLLAAISLLGLHTPKQDANRPAFLFAGLFLLWFTLANLDPWQFGAWFAD